ncbi:MAG: chaperone NapD [Pseudomonadales bacterium]|nr:chaperone NapD [Pseudomonadales bacterium]
MSVINVCGVLVHAQPEYRGMVCSHLEAEPGVEVHAVTDDGRIVLTLEKETRQQTGDTLNQIEQINHVLSTSLVYQYFDDNHQEAQQ